MRARYLAQRDEGMLDYQFLELLLTYALPRRDTNELAHALIDRFGTLENIINADTRRLMQVHGIGESAAIFLSMQGDLVKRIALNRIRNTHGRIQMASPLSAAQYAYLQLHAFGNETVMAAFVNSRKELICCETMQRGSVAEAHVYPRTVAESALLRHAHSVFLMHNHPSGNPTPSEADADVTAAVKAALEAIGVLLPDHLVVGGNHVYSFSANAVIDLAADPPKSCPLEEYVNQPENPTLRRVMEFYE